MRVQVRCKLRDRRLSCGYSIRQLQDLSGIHRGTISKYENDKDVMSIELAARFALLLGCKIDDLYEYELVED